MSLVDFPNDTKSPVFVTSLKRVKSVFMISTDDVSSVDFAVEDGKKQEIYRLSHEKVPSLYLDLLTCPCMCMGSSDTIVILSELTMKQ